MESWFRGASAPCAAATAGREGPRTGACPLPDSGPSIISGEGAHLSCRCEIFGLHSLLSVSHSQGLHTAKLEPRILREAKLGWGCGELS